jgi:hypothetical protein
MDLEKILINKDGFTFTKLRNNCYCIKFSIENRNIILPNILNFSIIKLMYDLNPDIYEYVNLEKMDDENSIITVVLKHLFEELGAPQRYSYLHMKRSKTDNQIIFEANILCRRPENVPVKSQMLPLDSIVCVCNIEDQHNVSFTYNVTYDNTQQIKPYAEKMFGIISNKVFKRLKQFIENVKV